MADVRQCLQTMKGTPLRKHRLEYDALNKLVLCVTPTCK